MGWKQVVSGMTHDLKTKHGSPKWIEKDDGRHLDTLFTGFRPGAKARLALGATAVGYMAYKFDGADGDALEARMEADDDVQSIGLTRADGLGYTPYDGTMQGMKADGNVVFAMHKLRNGG